MPVHPSAVVHNGAEVDASADIGPYCVVGPKTKIGADTRLLSHVVVDNHTTIGARNTIHPFATVGGVPQDLKFKGEAARLVIGDDNIIREGATLNIGTEGGDMETRMGNHCLVMASAHVAHDCKLGNGVILANSVGLAGHVELGDHVSLGGIAGVHQFCRVGRHGFLAGGAMAALDVPPFCLAQGDRAQLVGINVVGLRRAGWPREKIQAIRAAFRSLFLADTARLVALERTEGELGTDHPEVKEMIDFIRSSERGICPPRSGLPSTDPFEG
ncbi:MAG: acyl-ACP--UDP-N-acetylglucosamine O-acyltransferase [Myxococcota bacterium]